MQSGNNRGSITFESDPNALLDNYKLVPSLPTFLAQALHSNSNASTKLFPNDWLAVVVERRLFLWKYHQSLNIKLTSSNCREFELPASEYEEGGSANLVALSFGTNDVYQQLVKNELAPSLCVAVSPSGVFRVWQRLHRQQEFSELYVNIEGRNDEVAQFLEPGPCPETFLMATNYGRIFTVDARKPQAKVAAFLLVSSNDTTGSVQNTRSTPVQNSSFFSGLSRRVSSVWSYASSRVTLPTLKFGKLVRFLTHFPSDNEDLNSSCLALCLHQRQLTIWRVTAKFDAHVLSVTELEHDLPALAALRTSNSSQLEAIDMSLSGDTVYLLTSAPAHSFNPILTGLQFDGAETSSVSVESDEVSCLLISNASASTVYPCKLAALHSSSQSFVDIIEMLTGRCVAHISFPDSSLVAVNSTTAPSIFTFVTRQRGVYSLQASDRSLSATCCTPGELERICSSSPSADLLELGTETACSDGIYEFLSRATIIYWMGYNCEAECLLKGFFNHKAIENLVAEQINLVPNAFMHLVRRIINSRPGNEPRWRALNASYATGNQSEIGLDDTTNSSVMTAHLSTASGFGTGHSNNEFDFARIGGGTETSSRFVAKQAGMQRLAAFYQLFHRSTCCISEADCTTTLGQLSDILLTSVCFNDDEEMEVIGNDEGEERERELRNRSVTTHLLNTFLVAAEFTEFSRSVHAKLSARRDVSQSLQQIFRDVVVRSGFPMDAAHLLKSQDVFFQTVSLVPNFVRALVKCLEANQQLGATGNQDDAETDDSSSARDQDPFAFVHLVAQLLTTGLADALAYREKYLPALADVVFGVEEADKEKTEDRQFAGLDLPCWLSIGAPFGVVDSLLIVFNILSNLGSGPDVGGSGDAECACQAVELSFLLLRAGHQRMEWHKRSRRSQKTSSSVEGADDDPQLEVWFARLRSRLISTVAWQMNRPQSGLQLAERFADKENMVAICDHLDRLSDQQARGMDASIVMDSSTLMQSSFSVGTVSRCHDNLMDVLARAPPELQLADFALKWHHERGVNARVQSLLALLHDGTIGGGSTSAATRQHQSETRPADHSPIGQPPVKRIRPSLLSTLGEPRRKPAAVVADPVDRFLASGGKTTSDLAWLHQLGSGEYQKASDGLLAAAKNSNSHEFLGRKKTLLSLAKLSLLASSCSPATDNKVGKKDDEGVFTRPLSPSRKPLAPSKRDQQLDCIDQHLKVVKIQEALIASVPTSVGSEGDGEGTLTSHQRVMPIPQLVHLLVSKQRQLPSSPSVSEMSTDYDSARPSLLDFSHALHLTELITEVEEVTTVEQQKDLLIHIWMQALHMDEWKKPTVDEDAISVFCLSFFGRLLAHCLMILERDQLASVFPPLEDFLTALSYQVEAHWLPLLVETGINHMLAT